MGIQVAQAYVHGKSGRERPRADVGEGCNERLLGRKKLSACTGLGSYGGKNDIGRNLRSGCSPSLETLRQSDTVSVSTNVLRRSEK